MNSTTQGYSVEDTMTDILYFNISEINLSITSLFSVQIMSHLGVSDIIYSNVIDSLISDILKYVFWILASLLKRSWTVNSHHSLMFYHYIRSAKEYHLVQ